MNYNTMNTVELKNYAFTIQIPAFKRVNYNEVYTQYKDLTPSEQEDFIYRTVRTGISELQHQHFEIKFEKHKDGRIHAHGSIYEISSDDLELFESSVCSIIGVKSPKQKREVCYCIPILCSYIWDKYINKDQIEVKLDEDIPDNLYKFGKQIYREYIK